MGLQAAQDLKELEATWSHQSEFTVEVKDDTVEVNTDDKIFHYLNEGTSVNKATMTPGFVAKTTVGSLRSGRGYGGKAFVSRNPAHWHKGIVAREWTRLLIERYQQEDTFKTRVGNILQDAIRKIFG